MAESYCMTCLLPVRDCNCGEALTRQWIRKLTTSDMRKLSRLLNDELERRIFGDGVMDQVVDAIHAAIEQPAADYIKAVDDFEKLPEPFDDIDPGGQS